jgi:beta-galactosidase
MSSVPSGATGRPHWPARPGLLYGGDYNPEQWPESVWHEDVRLMREASVNLVTVGVFAWSRLQPAPGAWEPAWLDRLLDLLHESGIAADLATATASPPPWFSLRYPSSLPVTADGRRLGIGSRQHFCPSSPDFRAAAADLVEHVVDRYGKHPAVAMWHVGNEYGDHVDACYCDVSAAHFRRWLEVRYRSLDTLNAAWNTAVWSQRYGDWAEIMVPRDAPGPLNPAQQLDFRRFSSDALLECFQLERDILVRQAPDIPVTTNFMRLFKGLDHWRWAASEDLVSCDLYPDPADPRAHVEAAFNHDLMRSLGDGRPWLLMEQAPGAVDWRPVNLPRPAGTMRLAGHQAVARGADGVLAFQWRSSHAGAEKFHSSMLPVGGTGTRGWGETVRLGAELARISEVQGSRCAPAQVAMLVDWDSWWALELEGGPTDRLRFRDLALAAYRPFHEANIQVDVRPSTADLSAYRLAVAPNLHLVTATTLANLERFVDAGGVLVVGPFSGIVDGHDRIWPGPFPGALRDLLGISIDEFWPLLPGERSRLAFASGDTCDATIWRDWTVLQGAEAVASWVEGELAGRPAVTRHRAGSGEAWYVGTAPDDRGWSMIVDLAAAAAGVTPLGQAPPGVELVRRDGPTTSYLFLLNHSDVPVDVRHDHGDTLELLTGESRGPSVRLPALGVAVLRLASEQG